MVIQTLVIAIFVTVCTSIIAELIEKIAIIKAEVKKAECEVKKEEHKATKMIASRFSAYEIERLNRLK